MKPGDADAMTARAEVIERAAQQLEEKLRARPLPKLTEAQIRWIRVGKRQPVRSTRSHLISDGIIDSNGRLTVWGVEVRRRILLQGDGKMEDKPVVGLEELRAVVVEGLTLIALNGGLKHWQDAARRLVMKLGAPDPNKLLEPKPSTPPLPHKHYADRSRGHRWLCACDAWRHAAEPNGPWHDPVTGKVLKEVNWDRRCSFQVKKTTKDVSVITMQCGLWEGHESGHDPEMTPLEPQQVLAVRAELQAINEQAATQLRSWLDDYSGLKTSVDRLEEALRLLGGRK